MDKLLQKFEAFFLCKKRSLSGETLMWDFSIREFNGF